MVNIQERREKVLAVLCLSNKRRLRPSSIYPWIRLVREAAVCNIEFPLKHGYYLITVKGGVALIKKIEFLCL